ncbi:MAG: hypothetical protein ACF788_00670 [Novipirellula sp. JB048]
MQSLVSADILASFCRPDRSGPEFRLGSAPHPQPLSPKAGRGEPGWEGEEAENGWGIRERVAIGIGGQQITHKPLADLQCRA